MSDMEYKYVARKLDPSPMHDTLEDAVDSTKALIRTGMRAGIDGGELVYVVCRVECHLSGRQSPEGVVVDVSQQPPRDD